MKQKLVSILLRVLFYPFPNITITKEEEKLFEDLYNTACSSKEKLVKFNLPIPKYKFLEFISRTENVVFHGSNTLDIQEFEPRDQTLFDEWTSNETVKPIARLKVDPIDFYYLNRVTTHDINESLAKTWLLYKVRNIFGNSKRRLLETR